MTPNLTAIKVILHDLFEAKEETLRSFYFCKNLGAFAGIRDGALGDEIGFLQHVLNSRIGLNIMKMFDERNPRYEQVTIEGAIDKLPTNDSEYLGLKYAPHYFKVKKSTHAVVIKKYRTWLAKVRKRPYYKSLKTARNKILAHSQSMNGIPLGRITGTNLMRLVKEVEWFITSMESIVFSVDFVGPEKPKRYGHRMVKLLLESGA